MTAAGDAGERGAVLLALARRSLDEALGGEPLPVAGSDSPAWLEAPGASFVTLKVDGERYKQMSADDCHYMKHGYAADICIADDRVGSVGEIRTDVLDRFDLKQPAFIFELDVDKLSGHIPYIHEAKPISKFPATSRDITIIVDEGVETGHILEKVDGFKEQLIENINIFDVYEGDPIPYGRKSVSFRIRYRSLEETLQDEAINNIHKDITKRLVEAFNAMLPA